MSKPKNDIAQIKKYLQRGLDNRAMHKLERQALDDPFLADALEGYAKTGNQQKNLDELSQRLQVRVNKKVRRITPWAQLSMAASILIIIGLGAWLVLRNRTEKPNLVAATVKNEKQQQPAFSPPLPIASRSNADSSFASAGTKRASNKGFAGATSVPPAVGAEEATQAGIASVKNDTANLASANNASAPATFKSAPLANTPTEYKSPDKKELNEVIVQDANKQLANLNSKGVKKVPVTNPETQLQGHVDGLDVQPSHKTLTGYVTGADGGQPLIGAVVRLAGANFGAVTDANGKFVLHDVPEKKNLVVNYIGYNSKQVKVNASDSLNVALEPSGNALAEVVVTKPVANNATSSSSTEAHPSAGWKALTDYLNKNAVSPDGQTGKVKVSFMVDGKGSLSSFKIIKSLSTAADQKAIDLLTNGPAWAGNIDGEPHEVKVTVKFH